MSGIFAGFMFLVVIVFVFFALMGGASYLESREGKRSTKMTRAERRARIKRDEEIHQIEMEERRAMIRRDEDERLSRMIRDAKDGKK